MKRLMMPARIERYISPKKKIRRVKKQPINIKGKPSLANGHLLLMRDISNL